jgi:multicomponent Na+:H+ antiporter subunit E
VPGYLLLAFTMALIWLGITNRPTPGNFLVGYLVSLGIVVLMRPQPFRVSWKRLPSQLLALLIYLGMLFRDIFLSGIDVARRVLSPRMPLKLGVVAVPTQDPDRSLIVAALSANVISLTPGELVVELGEPDIMYVHSLDVEATAARADSVQARRLALLRQIRGLPQ